jgi:CTP:molybdopterin cytidylyltransferase MocA
MVGKGIERALVAAPRGPAAALLIEGHSTALRRDAIMEVVRCWRASGAAAVRPRFGHHPGQPVLIDRSLWSQAMLLAGAGDLEAILRTAVVETVDLSPEELS